MAFRGVGQLCFTKTAGQIRSGLKALENNYEAQLNAIASVSTTLLAKGGDTSQRELFNATFGKLADADGSAALASAELTLPALVSEDKDARAASSEAKKRLQNMWAKAYSRRDLYEPLLAAKTGAQGAEETRLAERVLSKFEQSGAMLANAEMRAEFAALDARCAALAFEIEQNINEDCTEVTLKESELEGCDISFVQALPKAEANAADSEASYKCSLKAPVLLPIMKRASCGETRRKMMEAGQRKCMEKNGPLLDELLHKRHAAARLLGFSNHAERMLSTKMAHTPGHAEKFCNEMISKIQALRNTDLERLLARKKRDRGSKRKHAESEDALAETGDCKLHAWDTAFYGELLKREEMSFDDEQVKEYFPLVGTIERLLAVYSELLGLTFKRSEHLPRWHEEVVAFEVFRGKELAGHLYLDQFPRDGKFGHQMVVPLAPSFVDSETGERCVPACVNISNLPRSVQGGKPALLRFAEMQTLFHELGHVMHCLCTTTKFSILSWAWPMVPWPGGVEQDFLEVPSMALEKFACEPLLLERVAKHYSGDPEVPALSSKTIDTIKNLERWMVGIHQSRFFAMALFDLRVHAHAPPYSFQGQEGLSAQQLFAAILEKCTALEPLPGTHPCASWYHLVIGYDAGYYGYGWSDVYAADVFESMLSSTSGLLSTETGYRLRDEILEPCASRSGGMMLRSFLGREPSSDAWCNRQGITINAEQ